MLRQPPSPTLFPYTTLFRSVYRQIPVFDPPPTCPARGFVALVHSNYGIGPMGHPRAAARSLDRKSTRLNSSHRCISYAVFCLKKKKKLEIYLLLINHIYTIS